MDKKQTAYKKAVEAQNSKILEEAALAKLSLEESDFIELEAETDSIKSKLKKAVPAFIGGKFKYTGYQSFVFKDDQNADYKHCYFQPYSHVYVLPGEHHAVIDGSFDTTISLVASRWSKRSWMRIYAMLLTLTLGLGLLFLRRGPKIQCSDKELQKRLKKDRNFKRLFTDLKVNWPIGMSVIELDWLVQIKPLGNGKSHVVLKTGRYGGLTTYKVGVSRFKRLCRQLNNYQQEYQQETSMKTDAFSVEPAFAAHAEEFVQV